MNRNQANKAVVDNTSRASTVSRNLGRAASKVAADNRSRGNSRADSPDRVASLMVRTNPGRAEFPPLS